MRDSHIVIRGARQHNLKNINVKIPRNKFVVVTGLSGSGKSSLAFDTIYAEGQRRYVESLSSYARQFLGQMDKPEVDEITGMSPSISIDQKTTSKNPRSTVGTVTEIYDYLRLLFARIGHPYCPKCGKEITSFSIDQMVDELMKLDERTKIQILGPNVVQKKGMHKKLLESIKKEGYVRVRIDGQLHDLMEDIELNKNQAHTIETVVDRLIIKEGIESRLADSLELATEIGHGLVHVDVIGGETKVFSTKLSCPHCGIAIEEISPRSFSYNNPLGACPTCNGIGYSKEPDVDLILPNKDLSIDQGGISCYSNSPGTYYYEIIRGLAKKFSVDTKVPIKDLPKDFLDALLYGSDQEISVSFDSYFSGRKRYRGTFEGIINNLKRRYTETNSDRMIDRIDDFMTDIPCPTCHGARLKESLLSVRIDGLNIYEVTELSISKALDFFKKLELTEKEKSLPVRF
ncbi:putative excinuclease ABC, A subunit [Peptoniphilus sp. oral taxon 375 str. F0436]|nr:putative excinuclease ABC, A subunit [Peptoniphilus sp. oral taxon 375 str. F0436]